MLRYAIERFRLPSESVTEGQNMKEEGKISCFRAETVSVVA